ncbi:MAG: pyridoxal-phosphate-dependent aminotransferase family protein [Nitrospinota bacterium]
MKKRYLLSPGPTAIPEEVLLEMAKPAIHHRTPQFSAIFNEVKKGLKWLFQTETDVIMLASSGTGAMESAVTNLFSPKDRVLVVNAGKFGERWGKISEAYGLRVEWLDVEWGKAVDPSKVRKILDSNKDIKGVLVQGNESSTTVTHPVRELAEITQSRDETLLVVDGITAVGVYDVPMDKWGIDVLITGSQKALMLPPGLAAIALSEKAWKFTEKSTCPRFYFDLKKERKNLTIDTTAYTPAASLITGLKKVLELYREFGLENTFKKNERLMRAVHAAARALDLKLLAPDAPAFCATGIYLPEGVDGNKLVKDLRDTFGVTFAGGQDHLKGKIIRISHMGYIDTFDIVTGISAIEMALSQAGHTVKMGAGVAAAQSVLLEGYN